MCLVAPAQVISVRGTAATVSVEGQTRFVSIDVVPDVAVGDWVVVAGSLVIRRVTSATAREMQAAVAAAYDRPVPDRRNPERSPT